MPAVITLRPSQSPPHASRSPSPRDAEPPPPVTTAAALPPPPPSHSAAAQSASSPPRPPSSPPPPPAQQQQQQQLQAVGSLVDLAPGHAAHNLPPPGLTAHGPGGNDAEGPAAIPPAPMERGSKGGAAGGGGEAGRGSEAAGAGGSGPQGILAELQRVEQLLEAWSLRMRPLSPSPGLAGAAADASAAPAEGLAAAAAAAWRGLGLGLGGAPVPSPLAPATLADLRSSAGEEAWAQSLAWFRSRTSWGVLQGVETDQGRAARRPGSTCPPAFRAPNERSPAGIPPAACAAPALPCRPGGAQQHRGAPGPGGHDAAPGAHAEGPGHVQGPGTQLRPTRGAGT